MNSLADLKAATGDVAAPVIAASDEEVKNYSWLSGLYLTEMSVVQREAFLGALLSRAERAPRAVRSWVITHLLQHVEDMTPPDRERFLAHCDARRERDGERDPLRPAHHTFERLTRRLESVELAHPESRAPVGLRGDVDRRLDIVLVVPEFLSAQTFLQPPVGMLLAAERLRRAGHAVRFIDNRVERLGLRALGERCRGADVVVATTTPYDHIQNYFLDYRLRYAFKTINALKSALPDAAVLVCGAHGTVRPDIVFRDTAADVIVKGEFDLVVGRAVASVIAGRPLHRDVAFRGDATDAVDSRGGIAPYELVELRKHTGRNPIVEDDLLPAYDLIDFGDYYGDLYANNRATRRERWATVLATRGCAFDCSYCYNFWGRHVRYREPQSVADELALLGERYAVRDAFFVDFHFTQNKKWVLDLCEAIRRRGLGLAWSAQARCDAVPNELLGAMAGAGCEHLWFGVESYDPYMIEAMDKYTSDAESFDAVVRCREHGIEPHQFIMVGLPGETRASLNTTIARMHEAKAPYCGAMLATPRFGTKYYEVAKAQYPQVGNDFYSLRAIRGLVGNDLSPEDLHQAMSIFEDRGFIYQSTPPQL